MVGNVRGKVIAHHIMLGADTDNGNKNSYILEVGRVQIYTKEEKLK